MSMNAVGIDVSKGKSMICVMRLLGEVVIQPFEIGHTYLFLLNDIPDLGLCLLVERGA